MANPNGTVAVMYLGSNGGGPKFAYELANGLRDAGHHTLSIVSDHVDNREDFESLDAVLAMPTFRTPLGALVRSPLILMNALRIRRQLRRHRAQALVIAMEHVWQAPILAMVRGRKIPQLLCVHDASMHPGDANRLETVLLGLQRALADGALTFSDHVAQTLQTHGVFQEQRIWRTVHGAYGAASGQPHSPPSSTQTATIGFFGRIADYKGLGLCYDAIQTLRASGRRVRFAVVGDGDRRLVAGMTHPDDQVRLGWVDDNEIPSILQKFDVLALPYVESSQSGVFAYAISQGLPMVVTPVGGLREQAQETDAALVARSLEPADFADALESLLSDTASYRRLASNGLAAASGAHSWARVAEDARTAISALRAEQRR